VGEPSTSVSPAGSGAVTVTAVSGASACSVSVYRSRAPVTTSAPVASLPFARVTAVPTVSSGSTRETSTSAPTPTWSSVVATLAVALVTPGVSASSGRSTTRES
jgi:hypothetical protein